MPSPSRLIVAAAHSPPERPPAPVRGTPREVPDGRYRVELVTRDGEHLRLRALTVADERGSVGAVTPVPFDDLAEVRLLDDRGREVADSEVHH